MQGDRNSSEGVDLQLLGLRKGQVIVAHSFLHQRLDQGLELRHHGTVRLHDQTDKVI